MSQDFSVLERLWESLGIRDFEPWEFVCKCGCGWANADPVLLVALQGLRDVVDKPMRITKNGGCRCVRQNARRKGSKFSQHLWARATDVYVRGMKQRDLKAAAETIEAFNSGGIGLGHTRIHVDVRGVYGGKRRRWTY